MADVKISALPAANTPLAGTEVLPIVQGGTTDKVSVADLTAGRTVAASAVVVGTGTVSAPSVTFSGDTNTGIYLPAADTIAFTEGGVESMRIDASGNVGIGTSSPASRLVINGGTGNSQTRFQVSTSQVEEVATNAAQNAYADRLGDAAQHIFKITGTERMRIDASGNVGIGTPSPAVRLHVLAPDNVTNARMSGASYAVRVQSIAAVGALLEATNNTEATYQPLLVGGSQVQFTTSGTERMRIDAAGNVGIGTSSPTARVHAAGAGVGFKHTNGSVTVDLFSDGSNGVYQTDGVCFVRTTNSNPLILGTNSIERARIDASGNVIAGGSVALATTATNGFLYVPTCAGIPTGTPTAITGMAPIVVNTTNNKLYFYSGGAWRDAGP